MMKMDIGDRLSVTRSGYGGEAEGPGFVTMNERWREKKRFEKSKCVPCAPLEI
jgi:hypothetical protein